MATSATETRSAAPTTPAKRDFRQEVTDRIVNMLEDGVAPWQKPWNPGEASVGMPFNSIRRPSEGIGRGRKLGFRNM